MMAFHVTLFYSDFVVFHIVYYLQINDLYLQITKIQHFSELRCPFCNLFFHKDYVSPSLPRGLVQQSVRISPPPVGSGLVPDRKGTRVGVFD